jgi:hypothetical protein
MPMPMFRETLRIRTQVSGSGPALSGSGGSRPSASGPGGRFDAGPDPAIRARGPIGAPRFTPAITPGVATTGGAAGGCSHGR